MGHREAQVLITGGAGFIGSHLARRILEIGRYVTVIDDLSTGLYANIADLDGHDRFRLYVDDIRDVALLERLMQQCGVVYHLASSVGVNLIMEQPVETIDNIYQGTEVVLRLARRYRNRVLITSTSEVYGKSNDLPFREEGDRLAGSTTKHRWAYACAKALDEFLALAHWKESRLPVVIARLFNTVGPRQQGHYGMVVPRFVTWALHDEPLQVYGDGEQTRSFCHVDDTIRALIGLMNNPACFGQVYNVGSQEEISINQLAHRVVEKLGSNATIRHVAYEDVHSAGFEDMRRRVPSIDKIRAAIGWAPQKTLDTIIDDVAAAVKAESRLGEAGPPRGALMQSETK